MKYLGAFIVLWLLVAKGSAQPSSSFHGQPGQIGDDSYAPLLVYTNGGGKIYLSYPYHAGVIYWAGQSCEALAVPDPGYVFAGWNPVNVFTSTEYPPQLSPGLGPPGLPGPPVTTVTYSPASRYYYCSALRFTLQPEDVIFDLPEVGVLTQDYGWQANFVRQSGGRHGQ